MRYPEIFKQVSGDPFCRAVLTTSGVTRLFPFGRAPHGPVVPYAVHQMIVGTPSANVSGASCTDKVMLQLDVYGSTEQQSQDTLNLLTDSIESSFLGFVVSWDGQEEDGPTGLYRSTVTMQFYQSRGY